MKTIILTILLLSTHLFASVATITALKGKADIERTGSKAPASLGSTLEEKDNILTQDNTKLQLIFKDETIVSIGKNSNFSISEYLFEDNQAPIAKFSMLKGAMRTITGHIGDIAPQKFSVTTRTATIGIRGTNFSVVVDDDGSYQAYCTYGAISVSISGVEYIVNQGFFISIAPDGKAIVKAFTPKDLKEMKDTHFGISTEKDTRVSKSAVVEETLDEKGENTEQLNIVINEDTEVIISELENNVQDVTQNATGDVTTYVMSDAHYTGSYLVTADGSGGSSLGGTGTTGTAILDIDFGADTASLALTNASTATFNINPVFTSTGFTVDDGNSGNATGTFSDSIGNTVNGTFNHGTAGYTSSGTYDVTSSQVLH